MFCLVFVPPEHSDVLKRRVCADDPDITWRAAPHNQLIERRLTFVQEFNAYLAQIRSLPAPTIIVWLHNPGAVTSAEYLATATTSYDVVVQPDFIQMPRALPRFVPYPSALEPPFEPVVSAEPQDGGTLYQFALNVPPALLLTFITQELQAQRRQSERPPQQHVASANGSVRYEQVPTHQVDMMPPASPTQTE